MKIGFTGTQIGMTDEQKQVFRSMMLSYIFNQGSPHKIEFHHGDCIGADDQAHEIVKELDCKIIIHPSNNEIKRAWNTGTYVNVPLPPLKRNRHIVNETQFIIATPKEDHEELRSGTWATIRYATSKHRVVWMVWPDGKVTETKPGYTSKKFLETVC